MDARPYTFCEYNSTSTTIPCLSAPTFAAPCFVAIRPAFQESAMRRLLTGFLGGALLFLPLANFAQTPANEHNCPATTAIPPYVGSGSKTFSPNQNLCLPQLAPTPTGLSPEAFIVGGSEPAGSIRRAPFM